MVNKVNSQSCCSQTQNLRKTLLNFRGVKMTLQTSIGDFILQMTFVILQNLSGLNYGIVYLTNSFKMKLSHIDKF